jgi:hypothetical protein
MPAISLQVDKLKTMNGSLALKSIPSHADPVSAAESAAESDLCQAESERAAG